MPVSSWDSVQDFELDAAKYPNVATLAADLKTNNQRLVAYIDSAVNVKDRVANKAYVQINKAQGFIQSTINKENPDGYLVNTKQGKNVVYYDWLND